jgi:hypothetical protein
MNDTTKNRAKQVVLEILRRTGGHLDKVRLYKAFYHAHLYFAENNPGFLSAWPFARMPRGPGIDAGNRLLEELLAARILTQKGCGETTEYAATEEKTPGEPLPAPALEAIQHAVEKILSQTPEEASDCTHEESRSWQEGRNGDILNVYIDPIPEDEYRRRQEALRILDQELKGILGEPR